MTVTQRLVKTITVSRFLSTYIQNADQSIRGPSPTLSRAGNLSNSMISLLRASGCHLSFDTANKVLLDPDYQPAADGGASCDPIGIR